MSREDRHLVLLFFLLSSQNFDVYAFFTVNPNFKKGYVYRKGVSLDLGKTNESTCGQTVYRISCLQREIKIWAITKGTVNLFPPTWLRTGFTARLKL